MVSSRVLQILYACLLLSNVLVLVGCDPQQKEQIGAPQNEPAQNEESAESVTKEMNNGFAVDSPAVEYVGGDRCRDCHQQQFQLWEGSHHDLAMQRASPETVLGNFNNTTFDYYGTLSTFFAKGDEFFVNTDGPDGKMSDYSVAYTFGVYPLQQYLVEFPGGRLQALNVVWDTRPKEEGGQRWFHLYPNERISHDDELHWTGLNQNWNYMCADCHSTNLQKNYDMASNEYSTQWSEIDVSCEACHGPASEHMRWAENPDLQNGIANKGFAVVFDERQDASWIMDPETGIARRNVAKDSHVEIETCAACHSRRSAAHPGAKPGADFLDYFQVSLLDPNLYHVDGQPEGEVYVYGSFVQSRMYHAGVTCSDCHQPHSLQLKAGGNGVCTQCHLSSTFETAEHHLHPDNSSGSLCVNCHMPAKNFMVVDARRDHGFRIPRPDLSVALGVPNPCTQCHTDKTNDWASEKLRQHFGEKDQGHFALAIAAATQGMPQAEQLLSQVILDETQPAIVRATAVTLLPGYLSQQSAPVLQMVAQSDEPLLGFALASVVNQIPAQYRPVFAVPLLYDKSRITQGLAAQALVGLPLEQYPKEVRDRYQQGLDSFVDSNRFNADRPESLTNLGNYYLQQGAFAQAEEHFREAIEMAPYYTPGYVNLADLFRRQSSESAVQEILIQALSHVRDKAIVNHALGLSYVRTGDLDKAIDRLGLAAKEKNSTARYHYVYGVALESAGNLEMAVSVLKEAAARFPNDANIVSALASFSEKSGNSEQAKRYQRQLEKMR